MNERLKRGINEYFGNPFVQNDRVPTEIIQIAEENYCQFTEETQRLFNRVRQQESNSREPVKKFTSH